MSQSQYDTQYSGLPRGGVEGTPGGAPGSNGPNGYYNSQQPVVRSQNAGGPQYQQYQQQIPQGQVYGQPQHQQQLQQKQRQQPQTYASQVYSQQQPQQAYSQGYSNQGYSQNHPQQRIPPPLSPKTNGFPPQQQQYKQYPSQAPPQKQTDYPPARRPPPTNQRPYSPYGPGTGNGGAGGVAHPAQGGLPPQGQYVNQRSPTGVQHLPPQQQPQHQHYLPSQQQRPPMQARAGSVPGAAGPLPRQRTAGPPGGGSFGGPPPAQHHHHHQQGPPNANLNNNGQNGPYGRYSNSSAGSSNSNGYRSQPDLTSAMNDMSLNDDRNNNGIPSGKILPPAPGQPQPYSSNHASNPNLSANQRPSSPANYPYGGRTTVGNGPPPSRHQQPQYPLQPHQQRAAYTASPPPQSPAYPPDDYNRGQSPYGGGYDSRRTPTQHQYADMEQQPYGPEVPSPTAVSSDDPGTHRKTSAGKQLGRPARISTNKIPPSSTVADAPISPLAAEYRKELTASPMQLYENDPYASSSRDGEDQRNPSPAGSDDVLNMYLEDSNSSSNGASRQHSQPYNSQQKPLPPQQQQQPQLSQQQSQYLQQSPPQVPPQNQHRSLSASQQGGQQQPHQQHQYSNSGSGKPPPVRQYNSTTPVDPLNEVPETQKPKELTVEEFETCRKLARQRPNDPKLQLDLAKKLVEASQRFASKYSDPNTPISGGSNNRSVVDSKTDRKNRDAWITQAYKIVKKLAANPYGDAVFYLASNYSSGGLGLEIDYDKAYELYNKAAKLDQSEAAYRVAVCNEIGAGTKRDHQKAIVWYKKAAQMGDVSAMYKLGMISLNGLLGQPRSLMEAVTWLQRAADKADSETPHAVHELGLLYERADSLEVNSITDLGTSSVLLKDDGKAFELFVKAAKLGYPPSQFRLGCSYEYGTLGCQIDPKRSIAWYSRAAEKGEPESELALSGWYLTGSEGILQQSDTEAYLWARKAAEKGLAKAEYALGYFSEVGIGVKSDIEEAKRWYFKAAAQKHPKALSRLQELRQER